MPDTSDNKERRPLSEQFEKVWSQALWAVSQAEEEATRAVQKLATSAGWSPEDIRRHARELAERLGRQRRDLEKGLEEGVKKALTRLPRREQLADAEARLARAAARIDTLIQQGPK